MIVALQVAAVFLAAITMTMALAHALEMPGKMRLDRESYLVVQTIYYPGFTVGGFGEGLSALATLALLLLTPRDDPAFPWIVVALIALVAVQVVYWVVTHPVNKPWLKDTKLGGAARTFFGSGHKGGTVDWAEARNRWEYSHVARAAFSVVALLALVIATAL